MDPPPTAGDPTPHLAPPFSASHASSSPSLHPLSSVSSFGVAGPSVEPAGFAAAQVSHNQAAKTIQKSMLAAGPAPKQPSEMNPCLPHNLSTTGNIVLPCPPCTQNSAAKDCGASAAGLGFGLVAPPQLGPLSSTGVASAYIPRDIAAEQGRLAQSCHVSARTGQAARPVHLFPTASAAETINGMELPQQLKTAQDQYQYTVSMLTGIAGIRVAQDLAKQLYDAVNIQCPPDVRIAYFHAMTCFAQGKFNRTQLVDCISRCFRGYPRMMGIFHAFLVAEDLRKKRLHREVQFRLRSEKLCAYFMRWRMQGFQVPAKFISNLNNAIQKGYFGPLGSNLAKRASEMLTRMSQNGMSLLPKDWKVTMAMNRSPGSSANNSAAWRGAAAVVHPLQSRPLDPRFISCTWC